MDTSATAPSLDSLFCEYKEESFRDLRAHLGNNELDQVITERRDSFGSYATLLALNRTKRPIPQEKESNKEKVSNCLFDSLDKVAKPLIAFEEVNTYAAPNPFAFNTGDHEVVFTKDHIQFIDEIRKEHLYGLFYVLAKRASFMLSHPRVNQISAGINFGTDANKHSAGASQPHLHAQIGAIYMYGLLPAWSWAKYTVTHLHLDPISFTALYKNELASRGLLLQDGINFFSYAPFAPSMKDEVHIMTKKARSVTDFADGDVGRELAEVFAQVIAAYAKIGIESFNVLFLEAKGEEKKDWFSFMKILPRESEIAYSELSGRYVVDRFPEDTVAMIKSLS